MGTASSSSPRLLKELDCRNFEIFHRSIYFPLHQHIVDIMKIGTFFPMRYLPIVLLGIGISLYILLFLFVTYPATCAQIERLSGGFSTCSLGPGAYILAFAIGLGLVVWMYLLYSALVSSLEFSWE